MASIARTVEWFSTELAQRLPDAPKRADYDKAVNDVLKLRGFRSWSKGLEAMAYEAYETEGATAIKAFLGTQATHAAALDRRDSPNLKENQHLNKQKLGALLQVSLRKGAKELNAADSLQAFSLKYGVPLLAEAVKQRYVAPAETETKTWSVALTTALAQTSIDPASVRSFVDTMERDLTVWRNSPQVATHGLLGLVRELARDLRDEPRHTARFMAKQLGWAANRTPSELTVGFTLMLAAYVMVQAGASTRSVVDAASLLGATLGGWALADGFGGTFHWLIDNYFKDAPMHRDAKRHHERPTEIASWPVARSTETESRIIAPLMLGVAAMPSGPAPALLATALVGVMFTLTAHGYAHQRNPKLIPDLVKGLQNLGLFISFRAHAKHHGKPVGSAHHCSLNGWMNAPLELLKVFRHAEDLIKKLTDVDPDWKLELAAYERKQKNKASA